MRPRQDLRDAAREHGKTPGWTAAAAVAVRMFAIALAAMSVPARRAARPDPPASLRTG